MAEGEAQTGSDTVKLGDGTVMQIARLPEVNETMWGEMKHYLERNPEIAKGLQNFSKNPEAMRGWLQTQAIAKHYQTKLEGGNEETQAKLQELQRDGELRQILDEIKRDGLGAAAKYWDEEALMSKINRKMGGLPPELQATLTRIDNTPLSLHEVARNGDMKGIAEYLKKGQDVDAPDMRGITPLGYAIGSGRLTAVQALLEAKANPHAVDASGNGGLHYAAGYGQKELMEFLLRLGASVSQANAQGQTPVALAVLNKHEACISVLTQHGAAM